MPNPQISRLRMLGLLFTLLGGTVIVLGWNGTAKVACVDCQMPYLLSGGFAGLGLIVVGVGLLVIAQLRVEGDKIAERLAAAAQPADEAVAATAAVPGQAVVRDTEPLPAGTPETSALAESGASETTSPPETAAQASGSTLTDTMVDGLPTSDSDSDRGFGSSGDRKF